ncbi:MAG: MBL fold metallo-hydrolase [Candidatus Bipolaricaulia bacterium]
MSVAASVPSDENLFIVDAMMMGQPRYGGVYILRAPKPAIVETAFSHTLDRTLQALDDVGLVPEDVAYIAPTHVHMDHAGGAGYLAEACPHAEVVCHHVGAPHLADPSKLVKSVARAVGPNFEHYGEMKPVPEDRLVSIDEGDRLDLGGGYGLEVLDTPGHAPHHASFYEPQTKGLFAGDAVGIYRPELVGFQMTTPPPAFHLEDWLRTHQRLRELDLDWLYFTHFGAHSDPMTLIDEHERLLRKWVENVQQALDDRGDDQAVKDHFVEQADPALADAYGPEGLRAEIEMNVQGVLIYLSKHATP